MADLEAYKALDEQLLALADNFSVLVRASRLPDEDADSQRERRAPGDMLEVLSEKLIKSAHGCLHRTTELKKGAMLSDFSTLTQNTRAVRATFEAESSQVERQLTSIRSQAQQLLNQLEDHYYASRHKGELPPLPACAELQEVCELALQAARA